MLPQRLVKGRATFLAIGAIACTALLSGCDEYVHITRDPDVHIARHATWAWRPAAEKTSHRDSRLVISRHDMRRRETVTHQTDADSDVLRRKPKRTIERNLAEKRLKGADDPED